jgi:hypothetical protein
MRRYLGAALLAAATLTTPSGAQTPFEGAITMRVNGTMRDGQPIPDVQYLVRAGRVRLSASGPMGAMGVIAIPGEQKIFMVMDAQRAYMEMPMQMNERANAASQNAKVTRTGKKETIAGQECEHVLVENGAENVDICLAKGLGPFLSANMGFGRGMPAWQRQLLAEGAFPLRVANADGKVQMEVTKIERKKLNEALFDVPDDYTKMEMPRRPPGGQ